MTIPSTICRLFVVIGGGQGIVGEDIAAEINAVRERAYGKEYFEANKATVAYPNDKGDFTPIILFVAGDENPVEAVLKKNGSVN